MAVVAGGTAVGYLAGPGLVMIGVLTQTSATGAAAAGALGAGISGMSANAFLNERLADSVYENALKWIVQVCLFN